METLEPKPSREEVLKLEVDLRHVTDSDKFLQQLSETLKRFGIDKSSLELIPIFFSEKKWHVPESTFINLSATKDTCKRLRQWRHDKDELIIDASNGEFLILNETKLAKWRLRKRKQAKKTETLKA